MASNRKQASLLHFGFKDKDGVNQNLVPVFGPPNLAVHGPQPKPQRPEKRKPQAGRPRKLAQPEHDSALFQLLHIELKKQRRKPVLEHKEAKIKQRLDARSRRQFPGHFDAGSGKLQPLAMLL